MSHKGYFINIVYCTYAFMGDPNILTQSVFFSTNLKDSLNTLLGLNLEGINSLIIKYVADTAIPTPSAHAEYVSPVDATCTIVTLVLIALFLGAPEEEGPSVEFLRIDNYNIQSRVW
jgi:hypothetical protein